MALIQELMELRSIVLDNLRVLAPDPKGGNLRPDSDIEGHLPIWSVLGETHQEIIRSLNRRRLGRKQLADAIGKSEDTVKKAVVPLIEWGFIEHVDGAGYKICVPPIGTPGDIKPA